ncbi:LytR/AlgR family response regulator transcription factor [Pseudotamlana agarivorans]|uniref:LytR/AlgR family response regulator transcription factor n=1 Tax=Pseudotamlana agarivorans TaxID=481183 RepID=UPI000834922D|nr:response regulator [Tamlana agarivorans]
MKPLKALIVEDDRFMATVLADMLEHHRDIISVVGVSSTGNEAISMITERQPQVVFLDVELPDMTGFEMLGQLEGINFQTIFTTAHSDYAIKAFRFNALDYLVKPIKENELEESLNRLLKSNDNSIAIKNALLNIESKSVEEQKLVLPTQQGTLRFALKQITHIEGEGNYSYIYLVNGYKELSSKNLAYFEDILEDKGFFRCHRSYLVNKHHIMELRNDAFILKSGFELPVSRRKKIKAKNWFI